MNVVLEKQRVRQRSYIDTYIPTASRTRSSLSISRDVDDVNLKHKMTQPNGPVLSEGKGFRLLQAYLHYRDPKGHIKVGRVQLDTQSAVSYALSGVTIK